MIQSRPSGTVTATAAGFPSGLVGTIGVAVLTSAAVVVQSRRTTGITEVGTLGVYVATITVPPDAGSYLLVWDDGENTATEELLAVTTPTVPTDGTSTPADWTPSVSEVGSKLRARTTDDVGNELGTFTDDTRPTGDEVTEVIVQEVGALSSYVGTDLPAVLWPLAKEASLARIAARLELDYWPEQIRTDRSPYAELLAERDRTETQLASAVRAWVGTGEGGGRAVGTLRTRTPAATASGYWPLPVGNGPDAPPDYPYPYDYPWSGVAGNPV